MSSLLNRSRVRKFLLDSAQVQGKPRLVRVSGRTLDYLERTLTESMESLVTMTPHGGPKTIFPPA